MVSEQERHREERKYEVFISSTSKDLKEIRDNLIQATLKNGHIPSGMELFGGVGEPTVSHIESHIRGADVFVILVAARRGSEVRNYPDRTYTELEYDFAVKYKKPILAFLLNENEYKSEREKLPEGDPEREHDNDLRLFREAVQHNGEQDRIVEFFSLGDSSGLLAAYGTYLRDTVNRLAGKGGWIRGERYDSVATRISLGQTVSGNPFFKQFVDRLNAFDVLSQRVVGKVPHLKRAIANYFLEQYLARLVDAGVRRFLFESGSSIAFLSREFSRRLSENWMRRVFSDLDIETNNILVYLDFVLSDEHVRTRLYPYGPPDEKYGATFGPLTQVPRREPPIHPRPLSKEAKRVTEEVCSHLVEQYSESGIIFMAASGIEQEGEFPGPHVGSYYNKLFKKAILASRCPTVLFLDETKMPQKFQVGKCFPVCDEELSWTDVCRNNPLAIAVAARSQEKGEQLRDLLCDLSLCNVESRDYEEGSPDNRIYALIASNEHFQSLWS